MSLLPFPPQEPKLVAMIPAFNEEKTIASVVERTKPHVQEVVVVDDGSSDATAALAQAAGAIVVRHKQNEGLGRAFRTGIGTALSRGASVIVTLDADGQFSPEEIPKVAGPVQRGEADMVTGTRFSEQKYRGDMSKVKNFGNHVFTNFVNRLTGTRLTDTQCGFRAYSAEAAMTLTLFGKATYTQEVILNLATKGFKIIEVPITVRGQREHGKSKVVRSPFKYAVRAMAIILKAERDYKPLRFFGLMGLALSLLAVAQLSVVGFHWFRTGNTSPFTSLLVTGGACALVAVQVWVLALIADAQGRNRALQDEVLFLSRLRHLR